MHVNEKVAMVERVATWLHTTLPAEFQSPMGSVEMACEWFGEDFNRVILSTPAGKLFITITSVVGEEGADVRVVVLDGETCEAGASLCEAHTREVGRVARAVAEIPEVENVWPDAAWPRTFLASVLLEGAGS